MQRAKFAKDDDNSPEVKYLLKTIKLEELLPKARDAVNLFFLNIKTNPQAADSIHEASLLRPIWRAIAKREDIVEQGGLKSVVSLLSSQTTALQVQAAKAIASLAADAQAPVVEALKALNVHITAVKLIGTPLNQELLLRLLEILCNMAGIDAFRLALTRIRMITALVALLEAPNKVVEVERLCYSTIAALAEEAATLDIITKERGLDLAVTAIHARDASVRFEALKVMSGFAKDPAKGRGHLSKTAVANELFQQLQDNNKPPEEKVVAKILGIVAHMGEDAECATQIEAAGIIVALAVYVLQGGPTQEKALKALLTLSSHEKVKLPILQTGVTPKLSLLALAADTRVLAIPILSNLASHEMFMREMSVKAIVELVNTLPPAPVLVQKLIARIVKSAARFDEVKNGLVEFGAVSILTGVMNQTKDDYVLAELVDVLAVLTMHERIRKVIIACGHTARIVSLFGSHLFERLELPIITVISNLTLETQGVEAVLKLSGAFRVFSKFAIWHENSAVRASALKAVANLMVNDAYRTEFVSLGGLDAVLYLLYEKDDEAIQTNALSVVAKLAKSIQFQELLLEQDIVEHLKELKKQPRFVTPVAGSPLIAAFRELVTSLKASGSSPSVNGNDQEFWIYLKKGENIRALKVTTDVTLEDLIPMIKTAFKVPQDGVISLMFKDDGYPVVMHSSDELLLLFMNYQDKKKVPLMVYDGDVPEVDIMIETPAVPAPPAPPPPPPGLLEKRKGPINPFASPAYLKSHELGGAKMSTKPQNNLLPENLMSEILGAVKKRSEGKPLLHAPINRPNNQVEPMSPRGGLNGGPPPPANSKSEEKMGEREWFRHVGKWYRGVHQIFTLHPILVRIVFDIVDSKQDHKSFAKTYEQTVTNLPHVLPHMQHSFSQDELADCLLRIGFNVKSARAGNETHFEFIVRPLSLAPELLLKAILLFTNKQ